MVCLSPLQNTRSIWATALYIGKKKKNGEVFP